jgi:hypothetical protein
MCENALKEAIRRLETSNNTNSDKELFLSILFQKKVVGAGGETRTPLTQEISPEVLT